MTDIQEDLVVHLLKQGQFADAIATYCEETGHDQETARSVVRQLAVEHQLDTNEKWWLLACVMLIPLAAIASMTLR